MLTTTIYRVEDAEGQGAYNLPIELWSYRDHDGDRHPKPRQDQKLFQEIMKKLNPDPRTFISMDLFLQDYSFGFESLKSLEKWFDTIELEKLSEYGYTIVSYQVDLSDVIFGDQQVIFKKHNAKLISDDNQSQVVCYDYFMIY